MLIVGFAVDENEIGPDMTVAVIGPFTNKRMINILNGKGYVCDEEVHDVHQVGNKGLALSP